MGKRNGTRFAKANFPAKEFSPQIFLPSHNVLMQIKDGKELLIG
jgi:hypothetical protein